MYSLSDLHGVWILIKPDIILKQFTCHKKTEKDYRYYVKNIYLDPSIVNIYSNII